MMPSRNIVKQFAPDSYYHIYNRGVNKQPIFEDEKDYYYFLSLFKRHLAQAQQFDQLGRPYTQMFGDVELLAFCLMPNHFHLLVYNIEQQGFEVLMRRILTAYSMYFNKRHKRVGRLFQGTYKASLILDDTYLWHISRYIHLNALDIQPDYHNYPYSSLPYYSGKLSADWLHPEKILVLHDGSTEKYLQFVKDYESAYHDLKIIKPLLAE